MNTERITIRVDADAAEAYRAASDEERQAIGAALSHEIRSILHGEKSITAYMDEISRRAEERGLTPEKLQALLEE